MTNLNTTTSLGQALMQKLELELAIALVIAALFVLVVFLKSNWQKKIFDQEAKLLEPSSRKYLRKGLGIFWILSGLLQLQPGFIFGFASRVMAPQLSGQPFWLDNINLWLMGAWQAHPVSADVSTMLIELGLGVLLLLDLKDVLQRQVLRFSFIWALLAWVFFQFMGGLAAPQASVVTGSPGSFVLYAICSYFLFSELSWDDQKLRKILARLVASIWLLAALLQVIPWEGFWNTSNLKGLFLTTANISQPLFLQNLLSFIISVLSNFPFLFNLGLISIFLLLAIVFMRKNIASYWTILSGLILFFLWWIGQDFGVIGQTRVDIGLAPIVFFITVLGQTPKLSSEENKNYIPLKTKLFGKIVSILSLCLVISGLVVFGDVTVAGAISPATVAIADSLPSLSGGIKAPNFNLVNQNGRPKTLSSWRGKVVVLTFLDPLCYDTCPIIGNQFVQAYKSLGSDSKKIEFVAIAANPISHSVANLRAFDKEVGLSKINNWQFLTGTTAQLEKVWHNYGVYVDAPSQGDVGHSQIIYFIDPKGRQIWVSGDTGSVSLTASYASLIVKYSKNTLIN